MASARSESATQPTASATHAIETFVASLRDELSAGLAAARPDLEVVKVGDALAPRHLLDWGRVLRTGLGGRRPHPALRYETGQVLTVRPAEPALIQVDGDVLTDIVRARITIEPGALLVAAP